MVRRIRAKNRFKNKANSSIKKNQTSNWAKKFALGINTILLIIIVFMFGYQAGSVKKSIETNNHVVEPKTNAVVPTTSKNEDFAYLQDALIIDEMAYLELDKLSTIVDENKDKTKPKIINSWDKNIARINSIDLPAEEIYDLYEEELPNDVIDLTSKLAKIKITTDKTPPYFGKKPVIAIVIDDMGISHKRTKDINSLSYPITSSFLTYATKLEEQINEAKLAGHEIIAHIPMEPQFMQNISPDVLLVNMSNKQILDQFRAMLSKFSDIKGVNNHMGSKFTEYKQGLDIVFGELAKKDMYFLDSKTTTKSEVVSVAKKHNLDYAVRNVFLDNKNDFDYIIKQLQKTESVAKKNGYAIAIGHPKSQTYLALKAWLPSLKSKNIKIVHLSEIVKVLNQN